MKVLVHFTAMLLTIMLLCSCNKGAKEKAAAEARQKAREDSIAQAVEQATRQKMINEQRYQDSMEQLARNRKNTTPSNADMNGIINSHQQTVQQMQQNQEAMRRLQEMNRNLQPH